MFVRIYTGDDGQSHFEDLDAGEGPAFFSKLIRATGLVFKNDRPAHILARHTAPRRQYVVTLSGLVDIRVGDGTVKTFGPADVLLAEDLTGQGHTTLPRDWVRAFVHLD